MRQRDERGGSPQITIREGVLGPFLAERVSAGFAETKAAVLKVSAERYFRLLASGQREILELGLSADEASATCDALNGSLFAAGSDLLGDDRGALLEPIGIITRELADSDRLRQLGEKWNVDVQRLILRLNTLTAVGQWALVDAVERFWRQPGRNADELLVAVGLIRGR